MAVILQGNALRGSWETLRQPVASVWSEVTRSFTSVANNLMGKTAADATDAAAQLSLDAFKRAVMQETAKWVAELFGEAAANAYRQLRRIQHRARLNEEPTQVDPETVMSEREAVLALCRTVFD